MIFLSLPKQGIGHIQNQKLIRINALAVKLVFNIVQMLVLKCKLTTHNSQLTTKNKKKLLISIMIFAKAVAFARKYAQSKQFP